MTNDGLSHLHPVPAEGPDPHRTPLRPAEIKLARVGELCQLAEGVLTTPVTGPGGQLMTVADAHEWAWSKADDIALAESRGSMRHRTVSRFARRTPVMFLAVIDFPIMLWLASSVFNVDWVEPLGLPLLISVVVSLLATAGSAAALHQIGHNLRDHKTHTRQLPWRTLPFGARLASVAAVALVAMVAVVMFVRVATEGAQSGLDSLAWLLAGLVALVMMVSAGLVFWTAFRDGSPEQDDLAHYSAITREHLGRRRGYETAAVEMAQQYNLLEARKRATGGER